MKSLNRTLLLGNVGKEPELKSTGGGTLVANFSLALNDRQKDASGNWQDKTEWVNCVAFARTAEIIRDYVKKGSKLYVEGKIQTRSWEKDGKKQYRTEIIVNELILCGSKTEESGGYTQSESAYSGSSQSYPDYGQSNQITDDDIPF